MPILGPKFIKLGLLKGHAELNRALNAAKECSKALLNDCKTNKSLEKESFVYMLLEQQRLIPENALTDDEIIDNFLFMAGEGGYYTAKLANLALYFISKDEEFQQKLTNEVSEVLNQAKGSPITMDVLNKMDYLHCVVKETLRLCAPISLPKMVVGDGVILNENIRVVDGTMISIYPTLLGSNPEKYQDYEEFKPTRWFEERQKQDTKERVKPIFEFLPFGFLPKTCLGQHMSIALIKVIIAGVVT